MKESLEKAKALFSDLPDNQKSLLFLGPFLVVVLYFGLIRGIGGDLRYTILFKNMDSEKAAAAVNYLDERGIDYKLRNGGGTILVPSSQNVNRLKLSLAEQNITDTDEDSGNDILLKGGQFGMGEEQIRSRQKIAQEKNLARVIKSYQQVENATVLITPGEKSPFAREGTPAKAAVMIKLKSGHELTESQVKGISAIVANSVKDLKASDVAITDSFGNPLRKTSKGSLSVANEQLAYKTAVERQLQDKAQERLNQILGPNQASIIVNTEIFFDEIITRTTTVDPEGRVKEVEDVVDIKTARGSPRGGTPGSDSQLVERLPLLRTAAGGEDRNELRKRIKYAMNRQQSITKIMPGGIKRLTVALTVSARTRLYAPEKGYEYKGETYEKGEFVDWVSRSQSDVNRLENQVKVMVGFDEERGDTFSTELIPFFSNRETPVVAILPYWSKFMQPQYLIPVAVTLALLGMIAHLLSKHRSESRLRNELKLAEQPSIEVSRTIQEVAAMVVHNPEVVAKTLQNWLAEDGIAEEAPQQMTTPATQQRETPSTIAPTQIYSNPTIDEPRQAQTALPADTQTPARFEPAKAMATPPQTQRTAPQRQAQRAAPQPQRAAPQKTQQTVQEVVEPEVERIPVE